ncbi:MAG: hypothetical protein CFH41_00616 [Alphaproteobacteria bacterium MarineAlpha11_Bin1]|nr:MAG: hypothetical protein CFH41_00616 [Alphaproteobacteria bacterium MarineAlpha11_Bin1]|tara:strand:- start:3328 stop:3564 length:237 start_codon:yes stop_codon:yes gene_type:complete
MPPERAVASSDDIIDNIVAIRDRWHTKRHPMFRELAKGDLDLSARGIYMAKYGNFVKFSIQEFAAMIKLVVLSKRPTC